MLLIEALRRLMASGKVVRLFLYLSISVLCALLLSLVFGQDFDGSTLKLKGSPRKIVTRQVTGDQKQTEEAQLKDPYAGRPRIRTKNGHLVIESSQDKNIEFKLSGSRGSVTINGHKLDQLLSVTKALEKSGSILNSTSGDLKLSGQNQYDQIVKTLFGSSQRFANIEKSIEKIKDDIKTAGVLIDRLSRRLSKRIDQLTKVAKQQEIISTKLKRNDCFNADTGQPVCKNGATCIDLYDSFRCICPENYEGPTCETDVDECAKFRGTELGCQNGAECINLVGGYRCNCPGQFHGVHCTEQHDDCSLSSSRSLCGNGKCINLARTVANEARYECICDQGWTSDGKNPACVIDINECLAGQISSNISSNQNSVGWSNSLHASYPCSQNPFVECTNLPGSFECANCPPGYTGNGRVCRDIDECATDNGGCSMSPMVECINTQGSRRCAPCPPGYSGDGITCRQVSACSVTPNGGCHPMAKCVELPGLSLESRLCLCKFPYSGEGTGPSGCRLLSTQSLGPTASVSNTSVSTDLQPQDDCTPNPCLNDAKCRLNDNSFECICPKGLTGRWCEQQATLCGSRFYTSSGSVAFPTDKTQIDQLLKSNSSSTERQIQCVWSISVPSNYSLRLTFSDLTNRLNVAKNIRLYMANSTRNKALNRQVTVPGCSEYLDITENQVDLSLSSTIASESSRLLARLCASASQVGSSNSFAPVVPTKELIIEAESNSVDMRYSFSAIRTSQPVEPSLTFLLNWTSYEPLCGEDLAPADSGSISSPRFPEFYSPGSECRYVIRVPQGSRIRMQFGELNLLTGQPHSSVCSDSLTILDGSIRQDRPVLFRYCANNSTLMGRSQSPPVIISSSSTVELILISQIDSTTPLMRPKQKRGFYLTYASEPAVPGCGALYNAKSATIKSSDFEPNQIIDGQTNLMMSQMSQYFSARANNPIGYSSDSTKRPDKDARSSQVRCEFEIRPADQSRHQKVMIDWLEMPLENTVDASSLNNWWRRLSCSRGRLLIYDGIANDFSNRTEIATFCAGDKYNATTLTPIISSGHVLYLVYESLLPPVDQNGASSSTPRGFRLHYSTICTAVYQKLADRIRVELEKEVNSCIYHIVLPANNTMTLWIEANMSDSIVLADGSCAASALFIDGPIQMNPKSFVFTERKLRTYRFTQMPTSINVSDSLMAKSKTPITRVDVGESSNSIDPIAGEPEEQSESDSMISFWQHTSNSVNDIKEFDVCRTSALSFYSTWNHLSLMFNLNSQVQKSDSISRDSSKIYLTVKYRAEPSCGGIITQPAEGSLRLETPNKVRQLSLYTDHKLPDQTSEIDHRCAWILKNSPERNIQIDISGPNDEIQSQYDQWLKWSKQIGKFNASDFSQVFDCSSVFRERIELHEPSLNLTKILCPLDLVTTTKIPLRLTSQSDTLLIRLLISETNTTSSNTTGNIWPGIKSLSKSQFLVKYLLLKARDYNCGGRQIHDSGVISSPRFPFNYPSQSDCIWIIQANAQQQIRLNFTKFELEKQSQTCVFDYLEIRNGPTGDSPLIGRFCNSDLQSRILISHSNYVRLHFRSDAHLNRPGFQVIYDGAQTGCGGRLSSASGQIDSPNYPLAYAHSADCEWSIETSQGNRIRLQVEDLDLSSAIDESACPTIGPLSNYLEIFDSGPEFATKSLGRFCHKSQLKQKYFNSTGNKLHLVYKSRALDVSRGFRLSYESKCDQIELIGVRGAIESPGYPTGYAGQANCSWYIRAPMGSNLTLTLADLELEEKSLANQEIVARITDDKRSPAKKIIDSDASKKRTCNDLLQLYSVQAYNLTNFKPNLVNSSAKQISKFATLKRILCGRLDSVMEDERNIRFNTSGAYLTFQSDSSFHQRGFRIEWQAEGCGNHQTSDSISPISFEETNLGGRASECMWTYDLSRHSSAIEFHLSSDMRLPDSNVLLAPNGSQLLDPCQDASLTIYDGLTEDSPVLYRNCDSQKLRDTIATSGPEALVKFFSSGKHQANRGFTMHGWPFAGDVCLSSVFDTSSNYNVQAGTKQSPKYPDLYDATQYKCYGLFSAFKGRLKFTIEELDIPTGVTDSTENPNALLNPQNCGYNYLKFRNFARMDIEEFYCGKFDPIANQNRSTIVFEQEGSWVEFITKSTLRGKWKFGYTRLCGSLVMIDYPREFTTPNYPSRPNWQGVDSRSSGDLSENVCIWRLKTSSNEESGKEGPQRLHLSISDFTQSNSKGVKSRDCLRIYEGVNISLRQSKFNLTDLDLNIKPKIMICSKSELYHYNMNYISQGNEVTVIISGEAIAKFKARIFGSHCGGEFYMESAGFSSPNFPEKYGPNLDCHYFILGSVGSRIKLKFLDFDLPEAQVDSRLNVKNSDDGDMSCDNVDYIEVRQLSTQNKLNARFKHQIDSSLTSRSSNLGYLMSFDSRNITRSYRWRRLFDMAKLYYSFPESVSTNRGTLIHSTASLDDFYENSRLLGRFCGKKAPNFTGSLELRDEILIRFRSHGTSSSFSQKRAPRGFLVDYKLEYGGNIQVVSSDKGDDGFISSPYFPKAMKSNKSITWTFETKADSVIQFDLIKLSLGPTNQNCQDSLNIFDGLSPSNSMKLSQACGHLSFRSLFYRRLNEDQRGKSISKGLNLEQLPINLAHDPKVRSNLLKSIRTSTNVASIVYENFRNEGFFLLRYKSVLKSTLKELIKGESESSNDSSDEIQLNDIDSQLDPSRSCSGSYRLSLFPNGVATNSTRQVQLKSPNWPHEPPHDIECHWLLFTSDDTIIKLSIDPSGDSSGSGYYNQVEVEGVNPYDRKPDYCLDPSKNKNTKRNFIVVHDGATKLAPIIGRYCLPAPPIEVKSTGRQMLVRYVHSDRFVISQSPGSDSKGLMNSLFKAQADVGSCGGQYHVLTSMRLRDRQDQSRNYSNNIFCRYFVFAATTDKVLSIITDMSELNLSREPTNADCTVGDYIEIRDLSIQNEMMDFSRSDSGRSLGRFCAGKRLDRFESPGSAIVIDFHTDGANTGKGWDLYIMSGVSSFTCPRGYMRLFSDELFGRLNSAYWPHGYTGLRHCKYLLVVPENKTIELTFIRLRRPKKTKLLDDGSQSCADSFHYLDDNEAISLRYNSAKLSDLVSPVSGILMRSLVQEIPCKLKSRITQNNYDFARDASGDLMLEDSFGSKKIEASEYMRLMAHAPASPFQIKTKSHTLLLDHESRNLDSNEGFMAVFKVKDRETFRSCGGELEYSSRDANSNKFETIDFPTQMTSSSDELSKGDTNPSDKYIQCEWTFKGYIDWQDQLFSIDYNLLSSSEKLNEFKVPYLVFDILEVPSAISGKSYVDENWARDRQVRSSEFCKLNRLMVTDLFNINAFFACGNLTSTFRWLILSDQRRIISLRMNNPNLVDKNNTSGAISTQATTGQNINSDSIKYRGVRGYFYEKLCLTTETLAGESIRIRSHSGWPNSSYTPGICKWSIHLKGGQYNLWFESVKFRPPAMDSRNSTTDGGCDTTNSDLDYLEIRASDEPDSPILNRFCHLNELSTQKNPFSFNSSGDVLSFIFVAGISQLQQRIEKFPFQVNGADQEENAKKFGFAIQVTRTSNATINEFCRREKKYNIYQMIRNKDTKIYESPFSSSPSSMASFLYPNNTNCQVDLNADFGSRFNMTFKGIFDLEDSRNCTNDYLQIEDISIDQSTSFEVTTSTTTTTQMPPVQLKGHIKTDPKKLIAKANSTEPIVARKIIGKWCGRNRPSGYFVSSGARVRITFHSNERIEGKGFQLDYKIITPEEPSTGGSYLSNSGDISFF